MRCPPLALPYASNPETLVQYSRDSSRITHADPRCTYGCAVLNGTIAGYLEDDDRPLAASLDRMRSEAPTELVDAIEPIAAAEGPS
jgi:ADP-ribosyl-[dinitrogen reductase] hydrolase